MNENGDIYFPVMQYGTIAFDTAIVNSPTGNSTNILLIMDSAFHVKRVIRSADIGPETLFWSCNVYKPGAIAKWLFY